MGAQDSPGVPAAVGPRISLLTKIPSHIFFRVAIMTRYYSSQTGE